MYYNKEEARTAPKVFIRRKQYICLSTDRLWWDLPACLAGVGTLILLIWSGKVMKSYIYQLQTAPPSSARGQAVLNPIPIWLCGPTAASEYKKSKCVPKNIPRRINKTTTSPSLTAKRNFEKRKTNPETTLISPMNAKACGWPNSNEPWLLASALAGRREQNVNIYRRIIKLLDQQTEATREQLGRECESNI